MQVAQDLQLIIISIFMTHKLMDLLAMILERTIFLFHSIGIKRKLDISVFKHKHLRLIKEKQIKNKESKANKRTLNNKKIRKTINHRAENFWHFSTLIKLESDSRINSFWERQQSIFLPLKYLTFMLLIALKKIIW